MITSGYQIESKILSAPMTGYNHTSATINRFSVNGAGGPNFLAYQGGSSQVCLGVIPRHWVPVLRAIVEWKKDPDPDGYIKRGKHGQLDVEDYKRHVANYSRHKVTVEIPRYSAAGTLKVHFLPCNQVRVSADNIKVTNPSYPYSYPMEMEEPEVC